MTYRIVLEHCLFPLSCKIISICILVVYRFILALLYLPYLFVREYYFGLQIDFCRGYTPFYIPPAYLDKIYIRKICYLSFFPNKEK